MRIEASLLREPGEHPLPQSLRAASLPTRGRPRIRYTPRVESVTDVRCLRRRGIPVYLVTDEWVTRSRYPVRFEPWLAVPQELSGSLQTHLRLLPVRDWDALRHPGLPELVAWLLKFDPLAARAVAVRNRESLDRLELYRRIRNEGVEREATRVRLQQIVPELPQVGESLPAEDLDWSDRNNPYEGTSR